MLKKLIEWGGAKSDITLGSYYNITECNECNVFYDDEGSSRCASLGKWEEDNIAFGTDAGIARVVYGGGSEEHTGGSSSYYDIKLGGSTIRCLDVIEALDMSYNEGNILKAVWRIAAAKQGKTKKGNNMHYDAEKIVFFGERLVEEHS